MSDTTGKRNGCIRPILAQIIVGIVGIVGVLAGTYFASGLASRESERQRIIEYYLLVFSQRIEIIERAANALGKTPGIEDLWREYKESSRYPSLEISKELADYTGEFEAVLWLASIYFGPETRAAISDVSDEEGPWWDKSPEKTDAFMVAMVEELGHGIEELPQQLRPRD